MTEEIEVTWDEAISSGAWVNLEQDEAKTIVITNWRLVRLEKFGEQTVEFQADVLEEDGETVEKQFTTTSNRLKKKLKEVLSDKKNSEKIKLSIIKVGEKFNTQYSVKEIKKED